jgi:hypothetical protein
MNESHVLPYFFIIASENIVTRNPAGFRFVIYSERLK